MDATGCAVPLASHSPSDPQRRAARTPLAAYPHGMSHVLPSEDRTAARSRTLVVLLAVGLLALVPSLGTFHAPLAADDGAILGNVARRSSVADLWGPQYGLHLIRFWRPFTTWSWELQFLTTGTEALPLRLLNVFCHVATACLAALIVLRLRGAWIAAVIAGALVALFPHQGGTVTWVAGRVDSLCVFFVVLGGAVALGPRPSLAAIPALLACGAKETGFSVLAWIVLLRWAAGDAPRELLRRTRIPALVVFACLAWRAVALGTVLGGYPSAPPSVDGVVRAVAAWAPPVAPLLVLAVFATLFGWATKRIHPRLALAGVLIGAVGFAPMLPMLLGGVLEQSNVRWLLAGESGLALTVAAGFFGARAWRGDLWIAGLVLVPFLAFRGRAAWHDTYEWAEAGRVAEERVQAARALVAAEAPSARPILYDGFLPVWKDAYCLKFGAVDRLRAPFEPTPRPVWPLRTVFGRAEDARPMSVALRDDGSVWPWRDPRPASLSVFQGDAAVERITLEEALFRDDYDGAPLRVTGCPPDAFLEFATFTEMGYEPAAWEPTGEGGEHRINLREVLLRSNGNVSVGGTLLTSADVGATRAYLEVRAFDAAGKIVAASNWIEVTWPPELVSKGARLLLAPLKR